MTLTLKLPSLRAGPSGKGPRSAFASSRSVGTGSTSRCSDSECDGSSAADDRGLRGVRSLQWIRSCNAKHAAGCSSLKETRSKRFRPITPSMFLSFLRLDHERKTRVRTKRRYPASDRLGAKASPEAPTRRNSAPLYTSGRKSRSLWCPPEDDEGEDENDCQQPRTLPSSHNGFSSNHILVNEARTGHDLAPLQRSRYLDDLARYHAQDMAEQSRIFHSVESLTQLQERLKSKQVAENTLRGRSIRAMHEEMVVSQVRGVSYKNILSKDFTEFGMGTAKSDHDGILYMVQLFRGEVALP